MENSDTNETPVLTEYTCVRCGYKYTKQQDFEPHLCHRCMRFIAKKVWTIIHTIQPAISTPVATTEG